MHHELLRHWKRLIETIDLMEAVETVGDPAYRVYVNPSGNALKNLAVQSAHKILKGLYEPSTGRLYVWDAYRATHATAEYDLALPYAGTGNDAVSLVMGVNDDGGMGLHVCDDRAEAKVRSLPSFRGVADADINLKRRWQ